MEFVRRLRWDPVNVAHIARHEVDLQEVIEVCQRNPIELQSYDNRIVLIGITVARRVLTIVIDPEVGGTYYPITARPSSRKDRGYYATQTEGTPA